MPYDRARRRAANAQKRQLTIVPSRKKRLVLTRGIKGELNKSGPPAYRDQNTGQPSPDKSKVPGQPGNKSGPAVQPPKGTK